MQTSFRASQASEAQSGETRQLLPSAQAPAVHVCEAASQAYEVQSVSVLHFLPSLQGRQAPPQSVSVQGSLTHCPLAGQDMPLEQSVRWSLHRSLTHTNEI